MHGKSFQSSLKVTKLLLLVGILGIWGCTTPARKMDTFAANHGFTRDLLQGTEFFHVIYINTPLKESDSLHIYIEGDGTPWINVKYISQDPTPRNPMTLKLMALDSEPSLYLGRPCYHGFSDKPPCSPILWTNERYSPRIIASMEAALRSYIKDKRYKKLIFVGYNSREVIAMLLAERFTNTGGVITFASNLDIEAWARLHDYTPLIGSLNPALRPPLDVKIKQLHLAGERDKNVPPYIIKNAISRQRNTQFIVVKYFDHSCCWLDIWPKTLRKFETQARP